jgi:lactate racemase
MVYAAKTAGLKFIINVVLNGNKEVIASFAGDVEEAHANGCEFLTSLAGASKVECDIAVSTNGGHPLDQNIYHGQGYDCSRSHKQRGRRDHYGGRPC